jgi:hypothetical protein
MQISEADVMPLCGMAFHHYVTDAIAMLTMETGYNTLRKIVFHFKLHDEN